MTTEEHNELNCWIAEHLFEMTHHDLGCWFAKDKKSTLPLPQYTTDSAASFEVLKKCSLKCSSITIYNNIVSGVRSITILSIDSFVSE